MGDGLETAAEIFGGHACKLRQLPQGDSGSIMAFDIFKNRFEPFHMAQRRFARGAAGVGFFPKDQAKPFKQQADDDKLIAGGLSGHSGKQPFNGHTKGWRKQRRHSMDKDILVLYLF